MGLVELHVDEPVGDCDDAERCVKRPSLLGDRRELESEVEDVSVLDDGAGARAVHLHLIDGELARQERKELRPHRHPRGHEHRPAAVTRLDAHVIDHHRKRPEGQAHVVTGDHPERGSEPRGLTRRPGPGPCGVDDHHQAKWEHSDGGEENADDSREELAPIPPMAAARGRGDMGAGSCSIDVHHPKREKIFLSPGLT